VTRVRRERAGGFTLIELLVVMAVIVVVAAAAAPAVESITGASARKSAGELAGAMRTLFDTAELSHASTRLAIDLDARAWWAECAAVRVGLSRDPEPRSDEELASRFPDEKDEEMRRLLAKDRFGPCGGRAIKKVELKGRTGFGDVRIEGRRDAVTEGVAYVNFFPGGRAQRAVVPVVDGDHVYSIVLEPMTGRARVVPGPVKTEVGE
jgi:general secretion pathway protein H